MKTKKLLDNIDYLLSAASSANSAQYQQYFHAQHLIFITSARYASVGTDYLTSSVSAATSQFPFAAVTCHLPLPLTREPHKF
ncbi:hypothetical protein MmiEs2_03220 [Methanimicrococcus stummii]|uniref:Uncharacterized protein n=1 Tax=Methanimicrococcus stummii TaxID=3028294 RepID=A0AA96V9I5_9EURY|nr:hypothetical protein [Methanimicrococcus sp. Es2]WNY28140.1 hypothetical protein MmiEs2_03220 [Methanimicrococcus sp. Es2]